MKRRHSPDSFENFIQNPKRQTTSPSILVLNDDCLLELYKYLGLNDFISLSKTCQRLKNVALKFNKKYSEFKINVNMDNKRNDYLEHIISNMNESIEEVSIDYHHSKIPMNVKKMSKSCHSVKELKISNWKVNVTESDLHYFDSVETLTMIDCDFFDGDGFFQTFRKLKSVNFCHFQNLSSGLLKRLFRINHFIESFLWMGDTGAFDEIERLGSLPELTSLSLRVDRNINYYDLGIPFDNLTKLQLFCNGENISEFLHTYAKLTKNPKLKELELLRVRVDDLFFYSLFYFQHLELLTISTLSYWELKPPMDWPQKLKHLRLESFILTMEGFISTIKQLEFCENIDVENCSNQRIFKDVEHLSQVISTTLGNNGKKVNFVLKVGNYDSIIETERFRIMPSNSNDKDPLGIGIRFAGIDENVYLQC